MKRVLVLGAGGWGTALALLLHENGCGVTLWAHRPEHAEELRRERANPRYLPGIAIPAEVRIVTDAPAAHDEADLLVMAVPTQHCRGVLETLCDAAKAHRPPVVSVAKGIENGTLLRPTQVVQDVLGRVPVAALSGPSHAEEVARRLPATVVVASRDPRVSEEAQRAFMSRRFRVYTHPDLLGVELGGAVKNVVAIAAGICDGLALGDNAKAALLSRGLVEIERLGVALGARKSTFFGLSGVGDLVTTCVSPFGRNREVGMKIGQGMKLEAILAGMAKVAEGVWTTKSVRALAHKNHVEMPITEQVHRVLFDGKDPRAAVQDLMTRGPKAETEDL